MPKEDTQFKGEGLGIKHGVKPLCVKLPPDIDEIVRALPNRSDWMRRVIVEAAQRELIRDSE